MPVRKNITACSLLLNGLRLSVKLGCGEEERQNPQFVSFDIQVRFQAIPEACYTDKIGDTVCYAEMSEKLRELCRREYRLIEHLGMEAFSSLSNGLPQNARLSLRITKERPPIPDLRGGASFCLGESIEWTE